MTCCNHKLQVLKQHKKPRYYKNGILSSDYYCQVRGSLLVKGCNDIIVLSVVGHYCAEVKLGLGLSEHCNTIACSVQAIVNPLVSMQVYRVQQ